MIPNPLDLGALRAAAELEAIDFAQAHTDAQHLKNYSQSGFLPPPTLLARACALLEALTTIADPPTIIALLDRLAAAEADVVRLRSALQEVNDDLSRTRERVGVEPGEEYTIERLHEFITDSYESSLAALEPPHAD